MHDPHLSSGRYHIQMTLPPPVQRLYISNYLSPRLCSVFASLTYAGGKTHRYRTILTKHSGGGLNTGFGNSYSLMILSSSCSVPVLTTIDCMYNPSPNALLPYNRGGKGRANNSTPLLVPDVTTLSIPSIFPNPPE